MRKICEILVCALVVATLIPLGVIAGNSDGPEVEDRIRDVKAFGLFRVFPQNLFKHIDVVSAWFYENIDNPDDLYISLRLREIKEATHILEAIYLVSWLHNNNFFITGVHVFPWGIEEYYIGISMDGDSIVDDIFNCEGICDFTENTFTWRVSKDVLGNLESGSSIYDIHPRAYLRFPYESGLPMVDLFKDFSYNAKTSKEYIIQY